MGGTVNASTYTYDTLLEYSYNNLSDSSLRDSYCELASAMASEIVWWIDTDFASVSVTAEDLGFLYC